jgi:Flp pilus assembly pilin Flp
MPMVIATVSTSGVKAPHFSPENQHMKNLFARFIREEEGQDLIEYALVATFVSLVASAGATLLGASLDGWYSAVSGSVDGMAAQVP